MLARMVGVVLVSALSVKSKFDYYLNFKSPCPNIILPVKEEPMDQIEESTLNSFIKQGPNDHAKDQEDNEPYLSGREVKEDDNEEEELVFPVRVFLVEQEDEDPLTTWSKHFNRKTEWSAGEERDSTGNSVESNKNSVRVKTFTQSGHEMTNVQELPESDFECAVCHKGFKVRAKLVKHIRIHKRPHECSVCQKTFSKRDHLVTHMRIHSGERPHACSVCQKSFLTKGNLVKHARIHSGERPYECSVCPKSFAERGALVTHTRVHSGERPHECSVCQKSFVDRGTLNRHMRIHTGERPYECP
ncbi:Krueppel homolog 1 [Gryllus bimaculatus]|nr:Krueppel homolog 1 [Gryllus bimaculatus]